MHFLFLLGSLILWIESGAQVDSLNKKLAFTGDFRFRVEHDWHSRNANGIYRDDRSRLRYRFRFGTSFNVDQRSSFGARLRSGTIDDQQGPHVTLGGHNGEFALVRMGLEKLYYQFETDHFKVWVGKNTMPLIREHELFWNDNVFPEGVSLSYQNEWLKRGLLHSMNLNLGHFVIRSNQATFDRDSYLQIMQLQTKHFHGALSLSPAIYRFKRVGNLPDRKHTYTIDYTIFHLGSFIQLATRPNLKLAVDYYQNLEDYHGIDSIPLQLRDEKNGWVFSLKLGKGTERGDWLVHLYYAIIGKYSVVDYFAQNDWARWDYSSSGASGSRLSNFRGLEIRVGYMLKENFDLILRSYFVDQLIREGNFKENGKRIRLDLNIGF